MWSVVSAPYHAVEKVQRSETNGLIFVIETLQDKVLMRLDRLGVRLQDLGHGEQAQVFHCTKMKTHNLIQ